MKSEKAVEIFALARQGGMLPVKLEDLVPLCFIGQAAVDFYKGKIKLMDQLKMTEEQRKATLRDGQQAGEMLLDIEGRIGELASAENKSKPKPSIVPAGEGRNYRTRRGSEPSGQPPKHERLGLPEKRMKQAQTISKHPEVVARVKAQAKKNEDIPTRTAVLNEINRTQREERLKESLANMRKLNADEKLKKEVEGRFSEVLGMCRELRNKVDLLVPLLEGHSVEIQTAKKLVGDFDLMYFLKSLHKLWVVLHLDEGENRSIVIEGRKLLTKGEKEHEKTD